MIEYDWNFFVDFNIIEGYCFVIKFKDIYNGIIVVNCFLLILFKMIWFIWFVYVF